MHSWNSGKPLLVKVDGSDLDGSMAWPCMAVSRRALTIASQKLSSLWTPHYKETGYSLRNWEYGVRISQFWSLKLGRLALGNDCGMSHRSSDETQVLETPCSSQSYPCHRQRDQNASYEPGSQVLVPMECKKRIRRKKSHFCECVRTGHNPVTEHVEDPRFSPWQHLSKYGLERPLPESLTSCCHITVAN